jgi:uncharacterized protein
VVRTRGGFLLASIVTGLGLGFTISMIGFGDFAQLNAMFTFQDLRMLLAFAGAVAVIAVTFLLLRVRRGTSRIHAGVVPGAILFGAGWAVSGGCPGIPLIQLSTGYLPAVFSIAGIVVGVRMCRWVNGRYFHLDRGSCGL